MPSNFDDDFIDRSPDFDERFGEPLFLRQQTRGTAGGNAYVRTTAIDDTQTGWALVGIVTDASLISRVLGSGANTHENVDAQTEQVEIDFDQRLFVGFGGTIPFPLEGWLITATTQPKSPRYAITSSDEDGVSRVVCKVVFRDYEPV